MLRRPKRSAVIAALFLSLNTIGLALIYRAVTKDPGRHVRVLSALPARDVDDADRFTLLFDEPLGGGATLGESIAKSPFEIAPKPDGHWAWQRADCLEFVLHKPLPPGRAFQIKPASDFEEQTGRTLVGTRVFAFQTRALALRSCDVDSLDRTHANIALTFNQPVRPSDLLQHLRMSALDDRGLPTLNGRMTPTCLSTEPADRLTLRVERSSESLLLVEIDATLAGSEGELALGEPIRRNLSVAPRFTLERTYAGAPSLEGNTAVSLIFTEALDDEQQTPTVRVDPPVAGMQIEMVWNELRLRGAFEPQQRYTATIDATLLAEEGATLGKAATTTFEIPDYRSEVHIASDGGVLSPAGNLLLDVQTVNLAGIQAKATKVYANNLVPHLRGDDASATSRSITDKAVVLRSVHNKPQTQALDLKAFLGEPLGIYQVSVSATDRNWTSDSAVVAVTDLAITSKRERGGTWVWVTSLQTAAPVEGAEVRAVSYNNQVLATATTDADGIARLKISDEHPDGPAWVITAQLDDDLAFLRPDERVWVLDDVDQSGRRVPDHYDIMMYPERGVYRPGDTIHLTGIVRDSTGNVADPFPLSIQVQRPDHRVVKTLTVTPEAGAGGTFHVDFTAPSDAQLGRYLFAALLPGTEETLGSTNALVEAFLPARIEVDAEPTAELYLTGDQPAAKIEARYLFGRPAAELPVRVAGGYEWAAYESKQFADFAFGDARKSSRHEIKEVEATLDESGVANLELPPPPDNTAQRGIWQGRFAATVSETGGRSVSKNLTLRVDTAGHHIGLRYARGKFVPIDEKVAIDWVSVNGHDELIEPEPFELSLERVDYDWGIHEVAGRQVWDSVERLTSLSRESIAPGDGANRGTVDVSFPRPGMYRLTAGDTVFELRAVRDASQADLVSVNRPERVEITLEHEKYSPGSTAKVLIRSPFDGSLLVALESDHVVWHQRIDLTHQTANIEVPIPADLRGSAFLTAMTVRPLDPSREEWLPHRAMGMARVALDHAAQRLAVAIDAPEQASPGDLVHLAVHSPATFSSNGVRMVHLWAVDDGILLASGYEPPNPWDHFFAPRATSVETSDAYFDLLPDHQRPAGIEHIGADGDSDGDLELQRGPVEARRREPAVVWSTMVRAAPDGSLSTDMPMPELNGRLRVMAVAVDGDHYGIAEKAITLTSPLVLEVGSPRYAAPGDRFDIPVKVFNNTENAAEVAMNVTGEGPVDLAALDSDGGAEMAARGAEVYWLSATAKGFGDASIHVGARLHSSATENDAVALQTVNIPLRPILPFDSEEQLFEVPAGETLVLPPASGFLPETTTTTIRIAGRPELKLLPAAEALLDYPYGCVEQTTSQLFALLYGGEVIAQARPEDGQTMQVAGMIDAGIARLWSMQTGSGGLAYWPGSQTADTWGTAYATSFLVDAKAAGRNVDPELERGLVRFLRESLRDESDEMKDLSLKALLCRVLAELDEPPLGWMSRLTEEVAKLDIEGRGHLAAAWLAAGRRDRATTVLIDDTVQQRVTRSMRGRITSQVRQEAVLLDAICRVEPKHAWAPLLARRIGEAQRNGIWGNSLENASAMAALVRYSRLHTKPSKFHGTAYVGDADVLQFDESQVSSYRCKAQGASIRLTTEGEGSVFVSMTTRGLRSGKIAEYDRGLRIRREWQRPDGQPVEPDALRVGDLIKVTLTCSVQDNPNEDVLPNVVIVDALPAGIEAENPRLETSAHLGTSSTSGVDRVEYRDDRVLVFATIAGKALVHEHYVRVVSAGTFEIPPVQAMCMYDEGIASLNGRGRMTSAR